MVRANGWLRESHKSLSAIPHLISDATFNQTAPPEAHCLTKPSGCLRSPAGQKDKELFWRD